MRKNSYGVELGFDDAWFRLCASRRLLDLANAYLGMWSKLEYVDVWYSVPPREAPSASRRSAGTATSTTGTCSRRSSTSSTWTRTRAPSSTSPAARQGAMLDRVAVAAARRELPSQDELAKVRNARDVHGPQGHDHLLQHVRLPPRRLRDAEASRAGDRRRTRRRPRSPR